MKKNYLILISSIMLLSVLFGCSTEKEQFNDENLIFNVINKQSNNEFQSYKIEITNKTRFELTHLMFNLSYPIKLTNGTKGNPFVVEGKTDDLIRPVNLKSGEAIQFSITAPIKEVFSDTNLLDFENPTIALKGYVKISNKEEIPFGMVGGIRAIVNNH